MRADCECDRASRIAKRSANIHASPRLLDATVRWYRALHSARVLARSSVDRLMASHLLRGSVGVGYGWFGSLGPGGERSIWTRGYESFGHGAVLATYPDRQTVIVVTSNSGEWAGRPVSHELAANLAELIFAPR